MRILPEFTRPKNEQMTASDTGAAQGPSEIAGQRERKQVRSAHSADAGAPSTAVTFNQDPDGQPFYKITNARTGELIMEFPPQTVRSLGKDVEENLQQHARSAKRLEAKA